MRVQSVLALMAASIAYAAPIADADYAPQPYEKPTPKPYEAPKPTYGGAELPNPFEVIGDAAVALIKWKLALIKEGAKIILSPFEAAYAAAHDLQPEYPAPGKTYYARDADYAPKVANPFEELSEAAIDVLKFKLALIKAGAKIILSPLEQAYDDKYHPAPAYPKPSKTYYARDAEADYAPKAENPFELLSDAAIQVLKFKLALIKEGAKIILSPLEQSYVDKYHPEPAYPAPKKSYPRGEYEPKKADVGEELSEAAIEVLKWKLWLIKAGFKIILSPAEIIYDGLHHPEPTEPPKGYYA